MVSTFQQRLLPGMLMVMLFLTGCQRQSTRPEIIIQGTVKLDGEPVPEASVHFTSPQTGESASANVSETGEYRLTFPEGDIGASYEVAVTAPVEENVDATQVAENPRPKVKSPVPRKYSDRMKSGLSVTITKPGENVYDIQLTSR